MKQVLDPDDPDLDDRHLVTKRLTRMGWDPDAAPQMTERLLQFETEMAAGDTLPEDDEYIERPRPVSAREIQAICTPLYLQLLSQGLILEGDEDQQLYEIKFIPSYHYLQKRRGKMEIRTLRYFLAVAFSMFACGTIFILTNTR